MDSSRSDALVPVLVVVGTLVIGVAFGLRERRARQRGERDARVAFEALPEDERIAINEAARQSALEHIEARKAEILEERFGTLRPPMVCPHCHATGAVYCKAVERKKGVSGAKATGAFLTGGLSLFVVGLSRKEAETQATCENCEAVWYF